MHQEFWLMASPHQWKSAPIPYTRCCVWIGGVVQIVCVRWLCESPPLHICPSNQIQPQSFWEVNPAEIRLLRFGDPQWSKNISLPESIYASSSPQDMLAYLIPWQNPCRHCVLVQTWSTSTFSFEQQSMLSMHCGESNMQHEKRPVKHTSSNTSQQRMHQELWLMIFLHQWQSAPIPNTGCCV